jgi:hypothetical protein
MTEAEWLACEDPQPMLEFLRGKTSDRKLCLLACSCCRLLPSLLRDPEGLNALEIMERQADGLISHGELDIAFDGAMTALQRVTNGLWHPEWQVLCARTLVHLIERRWADVLAVMQNVRAAAAAETSISRGYLANDKCESAVAHEKDFQSGMVRDIFVSPFRPVALDCTWTTSTVTALAQAIYDDRAFDRLPILADALEDAGCTDADILAHCRGGGEHVRGCWVVDLLTGRE